jgi:opacity protein-like surface antigen
MSQRCRRPLGSVVLAVCLCGPASAAADPLGLYVGGAIGQGHVAADVGGLPGPGPSVSSDRFRGNHFAFKFMTGLRPISWLGAELSYIDFGHPTGTLLAHPADARMRGVSAFGILYLPIRVIDVFAKAGIARIQSVTSGFAPNPNLVCVPEVPCGTSPFQLDRTNASFTAGAGAQLKFGRLAARAEYERFNAAGETPYLLSVGLTWSFF